MSMPDDLNPTDLPHAPAPDGADPWAALRRHTPARIGLGRVGVSLPLNEVLAFSLAHAQARDAIHQPLDVPALAQQLACTPWGSPVCLQSRATSRHEYLLRPDLGRRLDEASLQPLDAWRGAATESPDLVLVLGDGLSAMGMQRHGAALALALHTALANSGAEEPPLRVAPPVVVTQARVAVGDEVGERLGARLVAVVVGERPGLSSPDSLGIYLTHQPRVGLTDAQRNCISNVRPAGQPLDLAARRLVWLARQALRQGETGVGLKDRSGLPLVAPSPGVGQVLQG